MAEWLVISLDCSPAFILQGVVAVEDTEYLDHRIEIGVGYAVGENEAANGRIGIPSIVDMDIPSDCAILRHAAR